MDSTLLGGLIGVGAALGGVGFAEVLACWREARQRGGDRRELAAALAAELRGFLTQLSQVAPEDRGHPWALVWAAENSYFPLFDNIGAKLLVLPSKLAEDVVAYYVRCKAAVDHYRLACRLGEYEGQAAGLQDRQHWGLRVAQWRASGQAQGAAEYAAELAKALETDLLPRLDKVARGKW
jgi:hypothetical protein